MDVMCFDKSRGLMKESEHPFTNGISSHDIRITTHIYENNFIIDNVKDIIWQSCFNDV